MVQQQAAEGSESDGVVKRRPRRRAGLKETEGESVKGIRWDGIPRGGSCRGILQTDLHACPHTRNNIFDLSVRMQGSPAPSYNSAYPRFNQGVSGCHA